ncbi:hypothetical protein INP51_04230 [Blautia liquoris]|uniref:DivIVA protein n=1 Tax=Blautia liquoris TaxID=2779518 RepID=A0A7M2RJI7_9FIRM|nr:hypothetical protein [Blautia liquoris]QOV20164.1 hypothetical protein INP51_04230 [Blautia liquoris]
MDTNGDLFKTTLMGGYDKEDVAEGITKIKDEAYTEKTRLMATIKEKEKTIKELTSKLNESKQENEVLQRDIKEKYQSYIDNYDTIGKLVYDAQIRAQDIIKDAEEKSSQMLEQSHEKANQYLEGFQKEVDEKVAEGEKRYQAVQEELGEMVGLVNQVQRRFMEACKAVNRIVSTQSEPAADLKSKAFELESDDIDDIFDDDDGELSESDHDIDTSDKNIDNTRKENKV